MKNWPSNEAPKRRTEVEPRTEVSIPELARIAAQFKERAEAVTSTDTANEEPDLVLDFSLPKRTEEQSESLRQEIQRLEKERRERGEG